MMRRMVIGMAAVPLVLVSMSSGAVPLGTTDIYGKWDMRGTVVQSRNAAPVGTVDRRVWTLRLLCEDSCHLRARLAVGRHMRVVRLAQVNGGNRYQGSFTGRASCSSSHGHTAYGAPGTMTARISLRVTAATLLHASLVATRVASRVTTREECPKSAASSVRRYQGVPAKTG
jgi:hypothetical protein